jgi:hypothetical protein
VKQAALYAAAINIWLLLGLSLGWYYTFTYYGRAGWPMPMVEPCTALLLYYFSVLNIATEGQAMHWMLVFPAAGFLWCAALHRVAQRAQACRVPFAALCAVMALGSLPMALPAPWMAWIAAQTADGPTLERMIAVALRRGFVNPWPGLSPSYAGLALAGLAWQLAAYRWLFTFRGLAALRHLALSALVCVLAACIIGGTLGWPLRWLLE